MVYGGVRWRDGEGGGGARDGTIQREDNRRRRRGLGGMGRRRVGGVRRRRAEEEGWGAGECDADQGDEKWCDGWIVGENLIR
jgi:hypothetical protein